MFYIKGAIFEQDGRQVWTFKHPVEISKAKKIIDDMLLKDGI